MEAITLNVIITSITGVVLFALGFLLNILTGKNRAELRGIIAQARKNEADSDSDYAQLARDAAKDLRSLREEYEADKREKEKQIKVLELRDYEKTRELSALNQRFNEIEIENNILRGRVVALEKENTELRSILSVGKDSGKG